MDALKDKVNKGTEFLKMIMNGTIYYIRLNLTYRNTLMIKLEER
jgi:hypothetical protein